MTRSKWACSVLLIIWAFFTAHLSKEVGLFPDAIEETGVDPGINSSTAKDSIRLLHTKFTAKEALQASSVEDHGLFKTTAYQLPIAREEY